MQPWDDAPTEATTGLDVLPVAQATLPPGQVLTVRDTSYPAPNAEVAQNNESNRPLAPVEPAQAATKVVAIPVRTQTESRSDVAAGKAPPALVPTPEGDFWHATVQQLIQAEAINAMVRELALQSQLVARDTDQWILRVERESLNQTGTRERLAAALQAAGYGIQLVVEIGRVTDSPSRRNHAAAAEKLLAAEKIIFDDPFVQSMMRDFGAKIVPGSIAAL